MAYIWQNHAWPNFKYDKDQVEKAYGQYLYQKGIADGAFAMLSERTRKAMAVQSLSDEITSSSAIEGVKLQYDSVYSSSVKQVDLDLSFKAHYGRNEESVSKLILAAHGNHTPLTVERILNWHRLLFEGVAKAFAPKEIGAFRTGPVYVVHDTHRDVEIVYEGVPAERIETEMRRLLEFINSDCEPNILFRSAIASFWFVLIHPFGDGNGRISRAIADYVLSVQSGSDFRPYSVSASIIKDRSAYYDCLQKTQTESMDITQWLLWFISTVCSSLAYSVEVCHRKQRTALLMNSLDPSKYNSRQIQMLYRLADGSFYGKLTAEKWMKMTKCQSATATRDLSHLVENGLLVRLGDVGKGTHYILNPQIEESTSKDS